MSWTQPPPDPTSPDLLSNLRQYLINSGLVRSPRDASNPSLPPMWIAPRFGVPAPGQTEGINPVEVGENMVLGLNPLAGIAPARYEGFLRRDHVEIIYRSRTPQPARSLENSIRALINDKRAWMMVNVPVNESLLFADLSPVESNNLGWTFREEYSFGLWGPFTPVGP